MSTTFEVDEAWEWLIEQQPHGGVFDRVLAGLPPESGELTEAEIWPALAALIPAVISAAPAIISAIGSMTGGGKPAPARPAPAPPAQAAPTASAPVPVRPVPAQRPVVPPSNVPPANDTLAQIAAFLPALIGALSQLGGAGGAQGGARVTESSGFEWIEADPDCGEHTESAEREAGETHGQLFGEAVESFTDLVPRPDRAAINRGVSPCPTSQLIARFGAPRDQLTNDCQATTSSFWRSRMVTESIGPFRASGHRMAVALFRDAFAALRVAHPDLYQRVSSRGMLCVRHIRGRPGVLSNHGLGMAIDLAIDDRLDTRGDDRVQRGLVLIHDVFSPFGIYWGAGFTTEDAMHFEVGADIVNRWIQEGSI